MKLNLPNFKRSDVMVVGDVMLDRYWFCSTKCISSEAPVPILNIDSIQEHPGGASNVALNIAGLGSVSRLIGLTGTDIFSKSLKKKLNNANVICDFISLYNYETITKLRIMSRNQQLIRVDSEKKLLTGKHVNLINEKIKKIFPYIGALVLSDYDKGTLQDIKNIIQQAKNINIPILIDPKGIDFSRYHGATILTPNLSEFEAVVGKCKNKKEFFDSGMKLISHLKLSALLVTRAEQGMTLLQPGKKPLCFPTQAREVFDVTGAGDTVIAVLAASLAAGESLETSCYISNIAAGLVVGKIGTSCINKCDLENALHSKNLKNFPLKEIFHDEEKKLGIIEKKELKTEIKNARRRKEKIVITNGCFDILHSGHVAYLNEARKLGDRLIVAVNSDHSVRKIQGKPRLINKLKDRMMVLEALKSVDWVIAFNEITPKKLISYLLPDILVKGGNYRAEEIIGDKEILQNGGKVFILDLKNNISTSKSINLFKK